MPQIYSFNQFEIVAYFLVLLRVSAFVVSMPVFGVPMVAPPIKVLFGFVLSLIVFPGVDWSAVHVGTSSYQLLFVSMREVFIGVSFGMLTRLFFFAVSMSGQIMSVSMGLSGVQLLNPALGERSTPLDQFQVMIATLFFLAINGHHLLIAGLVQSFDLVPLSQVALNMSGFAQMGQVMQEIMIIGVKLSAPVMVAIFLMNVVMALIGRAVPQINVLITSLPVNILGGLAVLIVSLPLIMGQMEGILEHTAARVFQLLKSY